MVNHPDELDRERLAEICRRHDVARLSLFGSALTGKLTPESDIDLLVEFLPGSETTYFDLIALQQELESLVGRPVDLRTPAELSRYFRNRVMQEAQVQYAA